MHLTETDAILSPVRKLVLDASRSLLLQMAGPCVIGSDYGFFSPELCCLLMNGSGKQSQSGGLLCTYLKVLVNDGFRSNNVVCSDKIRSETECLMRTCREFGCH